MNRLTKIGLNAMVVFTLMFATTLVVAQERAVAPINNVEMTQFVSANTLARIVEKIGKETVQMDLYWFKVDHTSGAINSSPIDPGDLDDELCLSPDDQLPICAVAFASASPLTNPPVNNISLTDLEDNNGEETAGARYQEED